MNYLEKSHPGYLFHCDYQTGQMLIILVLFCNKL